jgi:hypothetical protein
MHNQDAAKQEDLRRCWSKQKPVLQFGAASLQKSRIRSNYSEVSGESCDRAQG